MKLKPIHYILAVGALFVAYNYYTGNGGGSYGSKSGGLSCSCGCGGKCEGRCGCGKNCGCNNRYVEKYENALKCGAVTGKNEPILPLYGQGQYCDPKELQGHGFKPQQYDHSYQEFDDFCKDYPTRRQIDSLGSNFFIPRVCNICD